MAGSLRVSIPGAGDLTRPQLPASWCPPPLRNAYGAFTDSTGRGSTELGGTGTTISLHADAIEFSSTSVRQPQSSDRSPPGSECPISHFAAQNPTWCPGGTVDTRGSGLPRGWPASREPPAHPRSRKVRSTITREVHQLESAFGNSGAGGLRRPEPAAPAEDQDGHQPAAASPAGFPFRSGHRFVRPRPPGAFTMARQRSRRAPGTGVFPVSPYAGEFVGFLVPRLLLPQQIVAALTTRSRYSTNLTDGGFRDQESATSCTGHPGPQEILARRVGPP